MKSIDIIKNNLLQHIWSYPFIIAEMGHAEMEVELARVFQTKSLKKLYARLSLRATPIFQLPSQIQTYNNRRFHGIEFEMH